LRSPQRVAVVTGGTTGIGLATAREPLKRGHAVLVTGNNPTTRATAPDRLPSNGIVLHADSGTVASPDAPRPRSKASFSN
jgi:NAD(P)-dependent dehydrogenase (short-subunit alcohol dehydrogenase family)